MRDALAKLGAFLVHLVVVLVVLATVIGGGVYAVIAIVRDHDRGVVSNTTVAADKDARGADTQHDSDVDAQQPAAIARGARAQRTVDTKARQADQGQPVDYDADDIRAIWGEPTGARP